MSEHGGNLRAARLAAGVGLAEMARLTHYSKALLGHLETGRRRVADDHIAAYSRVLGVDLTPGASHVEAVKAHTARLLAADNRGAGDPDAALRLVAVARGRCTDRDGFAAIGELAEVAGWVLYEAGRHAEAERVTTEAIHLLQLSGDRSTERLALQNLALIAGDRGRAGESLGVSRMLIETDTSGSRRLAGLFLVREARALAQLGDASGAWRSFRRGEALITDGVSDRDPRWAWWLDERELLWHRSMIAHDLGDTVRAVDGLAATSARLDRINRRRSARVNLAHFALFQARVRCRDASATIEAAEVFRDVRSGRADAAVREAVRLVG